jgi:hypothetical protein
MKHDEFVEKFGYEVGEVDQLLKLFKTQRSRKERVWRMLDAYDSGEFWDTIKNRLPKHQIIPDTNHVFYVKDNIVNSTYAAPYIADVLPNDPGDQEESRVINKFLEYEYNRHNLGEKQLKIGTRAALLNCGFLQLGWNSDTSFKVGDQTNKGEIEVTPRDPMAVLLDPNYDNFQDGRALFILSEDSYESIVARYPDAREEVDEMVRRNKEDDIAVVNPVNQLDIGKGYFNKDVHPTAEGMLPVYIAFRRVPKDNGGERIDQIIYTTNYIVLQAKKDIKPSYFPVVGLYSTPPEKDGYGIGVVQRILKNAMTLNILDSISVTHVYASQRTPTVLDTRTGLNPARVAQEINNPDRVFAISDGDVSRALQKLEYPPLPANLEYIKSSLEQAIEKITGVDQKYIGRDTASVTTTGGMERLQSRVSMTDNTRINLIEKYAKELTRMMMDFYIHFGGTRYFATNPEYMEEQKEALEIDFNKYKGRYNGTHQFSYHIEASPLLPKNRARLAEAANLIMQVQMQYQGQVELLTPEEWLFYQDFPQKDMILDRMKLDRLKDDYEEISSEIASFGAMTEEGMRPEAAVDQLAQERKTKREPGVMRKQLQNM